jgi:hypothetical protein
MKNFIIIRTNTAKLKMYFNNLIQILSLKIKVFNNRIVLPIMIKINLMQIMIMITLIPIPIILLNKTQLNTKASMKSLNKNKILESQITLNNNNNLEENLNIDS